MMKMISWLKDRIRHIQRKADAPKVMGPKEGQANEAGRAIIPDGAEETAEEAQHIQEKTDASKVIGPKEGQADEEGRAIIPDGAEETAEEAQQLQGETAVPKVIVPKEGQVDEEGRAVIPDGVEEIADDAFYQCDALCSAVLPSSVRQVGDRAFACCVNLKTLQLNDELEYIGRFVIKSSPNLKDFTVPDGAKTIWNSFMDCTCRQPILSRSGETLYRSGVSWRDSITEYRGPEGLRRIAHMAFDEINSLKTLSFADGLEQIDMNAFGGWYFQVEKISIPASVKCIATAAFHSCKSLKTVDLACDFSAVSRGALWDCKLAACFHRGKKLTYRQILHAFGKIEPYMPDGVGIPEDFSQDETFLSYADRCSRGDTEAMMAFAAYFEARGEDAFYRLAANTWRCRAARFGNAQAQAWLESYVEETSMGSIPTLVMDGYGRDLPGDKLRAAGFQFFCSDREYDIILSDDGERVFVRSYSGYDSPDEDGFGMEANWDEWTLDKHLCIIKREE